MREKLTDSEEKTLNSVTDSFKDWMKANGIEGVYAYDLDKNLVLENVAYGVSENGKFLMIGFSRKNNHKCGDC